MCIDSRLITTLVCLCFIITEFEFFWSVLTILCQFSILLFADKHSHCTQLPEADVSPNTINQTRNINQHNNERIYEENNQNIDNKLSCKVPITGNRNSNISKC